MDRSDVAKALAGQGVGTYDQVRETLKEVEVDATCVVGSGRGQTLPWWSWMTLQSC